MDDLARGERIKELRQERRLTQPAVVDLLEKKAGAPVITLRGYQAWEAGGGIKWENAKVLADVFGIDPEFVMSGQAERTETPDILGVPEQLAEVDTKFSDRVDQVEETLSRLEAKVDRLMHFVDQGLFTPRSEDGGSREDQVPLGAALASIFQADPGLLRALRDSLAQSTAPARTGRERTKRPAA